MTLNLEFDLDRFEMNRQAKRNIQVKGHLAHKSLSEHTDTHRPGCSTWATKMVGNKQVMPNSLNNAKCGELLAFCNGCPGAIILPYFSAEYITLLTYSRRVRGMKERPASSECEPVDCVPATATTSDPRSRGVVARNDLQAQRHRVVDVYHARNTTLWCCCGRSVRKLVTVNK